MIIQLIYWRWVCGRLARRSPDGQGNTAPSDEERQAFARRLDRHRGERFIRYR
jgi:hypothetical protein